VQVLGHRNEVAQLAQVDVGSHLAGTDALLPAAIARLKRSRPLVTVIVRKAAPDELLIDLEAGRVDLVVGRLTSATARPQTRQRVLYREPLRLTVRRGHPAAAVAEPELADLLQYSWIVPVTNTALRRELEGLLVDRDLELPRDRVECSSFPIVRQLLIETDMVAALPMHLGSDDRLVALPTPLTPLSQSIGTITPADRTTSPSTAALLDELGHVALELAAVDRLRLAAERA
jgi:DNA-binding transcriptional LysR family regulator